MTSHTHFATTLTLAATAALFTTALCASTLDGPEKCPVMGAEGSYSYDPTTPTGPSHWGETPDHHMCGDGHSQSPINFPLPTAFKEVSEGPTPGMTPGRYKFAAGSYNWAANCAVAGSCGSTMFSGKQFNVLGVHFHAPSEHVLNGTQYPLEAHIVHASDDGQLAVIATMFEYPDDDTYAAKVYAEMPKEWGTNHLVAKLLREMKSDADDFEMNLGSIVKPKKGYCSYVGSLTTPPCSEGVTFFMAMHTETVTKRQVAQYSLSCGVGADGNNRPLMPVNGRHVTCYC